MTLEDFAHRCLMIKAGNAELAIPCCANCKYYEREEECNGIHGALSSLKGTIVEHLYNGGTAKVVKKVEGENGIEFFCETDGTFISEEEAEKIQSENISESIQYKYECHHPAQESDDPFEGAWLEMKPEDFCSRWEEKDG